MYFVIALIIFTLNFFAVGVTIGFILLHIGAYPLDLKALFRKQYTRSFLVTLSHKFPLLLYPLNIYILFFCFFLICGYVFFNQAFIAVSLRSYALLLAYQHLVHIFNECSYGFSCPKCKFKLQLF